MMPTPGHHLWRLLPFASQIIDNRDKTPFIASKRNLAQYQLPEEVKPTPKVAEALVILRKARDKLLERDQEISSALRHALSATTLLGEQPESDWIRKELLGYKTDDELPSYRFIHPDYFSSVGSLLELERKGNFYPVFDPVLVIQSKLKAGGITYTVTSDEREAIKEPYAKTMKIFPEHLERCISGIGIRVLEYVNGLITKYEFSGVPTSIFESYRMRADDLLVKSSPETTRKLTLAYERLTTATDPEHLSEVCLDCRRILIEVADVLFTPQGEPYLDRSGVKLQVGPDNYINRLIAYVDRCASKDERRIVMAETRHIGDLLEQVNIAATKGLHHTASKLDATRCIIYTYLLLSDILSIGPEPSN